MNKEVSTRIVNSMIPLGRGSCWERGQEGKVKIIYNSFDDVHIDCYCFNRLKLSSAIVIINLFYDGYFDLNIWALLRRSQCRVSDTQVTVKAHGAFFA